MPASTVLPEQSDPDESDGSPYTPGLDDLEQQREHDVQSLQPTSREATESDAQADARQLLQEATDIVAARYETVEDFIPDHSLDVVPADSTTNSKFPYDAMARSHVLKLISPRIGDYGLLEFLLTQNHEWAARMGFDPQDIPDRTTFSNQWWTRWRETYRSHLRFEAARAATLAKTYDLEISEHAETLIDAYLPDDENPDIPEKYRLEMSARDRVFNEYRDLFHNVIDYGRGSNKQIGADRLTDLATFISRRNETVSGGRDVYVRENKVTDGDFMTEEALAKPIREYSRKLAESNYASNHALVPGEDCYDWSVNPEDRDFGEGETWHKRTERGINEQVEMLQSRGMLDRPVDICIDGTARLYHKRGDTDVEQPDGVHRRYKKFRTGYAWEDITVTAIYRGRAIVLANISYVPADSHFQAVRYLIDRALDLVHVRNVYADSEYGTQMICEYINHCGLDYVIKKRATSKVNRKLEEDIEGQAGWCAYEIEGGDHSLHKTTLLALPKVSKHAEEHARSKTGTDDEEDESGTVQTTLFDEPTEDELENVETDPEGNPIVEEEEDRDYASFVTSFDIEAVGLHPDDAGPRRDTATVFGVGELYRKRWSIETAFRDIKQNFKAGPRGRCLGTRRFFFMLCILLYNCWVLLNIIVAAEMEHRDDDEIVWRKKIFIIDIHNEVFSDLEFG